MFDVIMCVFYKFMIFKVKTSLHNDGHFLAIFWIVFVNDILFCIVIFNDFLSNYYIYCYLFYIPDENRRLLQKTNNIDKKMKKYLKLYHNIILKTPEFQYIIFQWNWDKTQFKNINKNIKSYFKTTGIVSWIFCGLIFLGIFFVFYSKVSFIIILWIYIFSFDAVLLTKTNMITGLVQTISLNWCFRIKWMS